RIERETLELQGLNALRCLGLLGGRLVGNAGLAELLDLFFESSVADGFAVGLHSLGVFVLVVGHGIAFLLFLLAARNARVRRPRKTGSSVVCVFVPRRIVAFALGSVTAGRV